MKKISMQDIAIYLGISKNAVSLALNGKPGVSEELRQTVFKTASEMNYQGISENDVQKSKNILVLIPQYIIDDKMFYPEIYWSVENEARVNGYNAIITCLTSELEEKLLLPEIYLKMSFSGIVIIGVVNRSYIEKLQTNNLPIVLVDNYYDELKVDAVTTANQEGAYLAVKYLIENGHKDIGIVAPVHVTSSFYDRWLGFKKAMNTSSLEINEKHCVFENSPLGTLLRDPDELENYINKMESFPTAWFCGNDMIAIALMNVMIRKGIKVPEDISVIGFDDIEAAHLINPGLTTIRVEKGLLGRRAVDVMISDIESSGLYGKMSIYGELVVRGTVKDIKI